MLCLLAVVTVWPNDLQLDRPFAGYEEIWGALNDGCAVLLGLSTLQMRDDCSNGIGFAEWSDARLNVLWFAPERSAAASASAMSATSS